MSNLSSFLRTSSFNSGLSKGSEKKRREEKKKGGKLDLSQIVSHRFPRGTARLPQLPMPSWEGVTLTTALTFSDIALRGGAGPVTSPSPAGSPRSVQICSTASASSPCHPRSYHPLTLRIHHPQALSPSPTSTDRPL